MRERPFRRNDRFRIVNAPTDPLMRSPANALLLCSIVCLSFLTGCKSNESRIAIEDGVLLVQGTPYDIRGICWNPVPVGETHPTGLAFRRESSTYSLPYLERDLNLIADAGFNTIRTYAPIVETEVLDLIHARGLKAIVPVYIYHAISDAEIREIVSNLKVHPAILFWEIGNEWNYNNFYNSKGSFESSVARVREVIEIVRSIDSRLPISTNYGEIPSQELVDSLPVDLWGINIYRSASFGDAFERWESLGDKPIYIGEYGADAIDNRNKDGLYAPQDQEFAVVELTKLIMSEYASKKRGSVLGGAIFAFNDEWWKDGSGSPSTHDIGGIAPGGGPYPDEEFNEEWWGIVDIDRNPRPAYHAIRELYSSEK